MTDDVERVSVPMKDWLEMHRNEGMAHGLLMGWLYWDGTASHMERLRAVTQKHLDGRAASISKGTAND